jgi:hypothetical protein
MPQVQKPGTSAEHQRAYDANALKRVKKLLKLGNSFAGEEDTVLRVREVLWKQQTFNGLGQDSKGQDKMQLRCIDSQLTSD